MKKSDLLSAAWLLLTMVGVGWTVAHGADEKHVSAAPAKSVRAADATYARLPDGARGVADANGHIVPVRRYARIASVSSTADAILLALLEPERIHALSDYGRAHSDEAHRYGARSSIVGLHQLEQLVDEKVDLLLMNHLRSPSELARTREAGIQAFNLGEMRGLSTLIPNIHAVAALVGEPERGRRFADKLVRRMRMVAADIPPERRKRALYVSAYANQIFGGAPGTSYHDVIVHAGLIDVAEGRYEGWARYDPEQLVVLDPELIVANEGTSQGLCRIGGLERLRACQNGGAGIVTLPTDLLGDPGPRMLEASETLRSVVYGDRN
jgi:iron complex transport system substrate-binding protein